MQTSDTLSRFRVTRDAARRILEQAAGTGVGGPALRVAARQEADGSISYGMGFDEVAPDDTPLEFDGLTVLFAPGCEPLLEDTVLDFVEMEPGRFHFVFIPPAGAGACGSRGMGAGGCGSGGCGSCG